MTIDPHFPVKVEQVGLVMVHGIGEQGRFEHLDAHIRGIINGLRRTGAKVSVEIVSSPVAVFQAKQDTHLEKRRTQQKLAEIWNVIF